MTKKRFRFDNKYLYGSAAFVVGFGGIMTYFVHFAPVRVPNANVATIPQIAREDKPSEASISAAQQEAQAQPSNAAADNGAPVAPQPTPTNNPIVAAPAASETPSEAETPAPVTPAPTQPEPVEDGEEEEETPAPIVIEVPGVSPLLNNLFTEQPSL